MTNLTSNATMFYAVETIADSLMIILSGIMLFKLHTLPFSALNLCAMALFILNSILIIKNFKLKPEYKEFLTVSDLINFSTFCVAMYLINVKF